MLCYVVAIAEVYKNEGNSEYSKKNFDNAIHFYTEGIKVNCKDEDLNAKLHSNRSAAHLNLGKKNVLYCTLFIFCQSVLLGTYSERLRQSVEKALNLRVTFEYTVYFFICIT